MFNCVLIVRAYINANVLLARQKTKKNKYLPKFSVGKNTKFNVGGTKKNLRKMRKAGSMKRWIRFLI